MAELDMLEEVPTEFSKLREQVKRFCRTEEAADR